jgi:iron(III) transport system ATP-binding protein
MRQEIRALQRRLGITTIYVTHDQEEAMAVSDRIVVMDRGSVVQEGTAEDLYYRPATPFVAGFIGRVNLIGGTVTEASDGSRGVAVLGTVIPVPRIGPNLAVGEKVHIVLRPEAIAIAANGETASLRAKVLSRTFLGEKIEYLLEVGGTTLQSVRYNAGPRDVAAEGAEVALSIAADGLGVLQGSAT